MATAPQWERLWPLGKEKGEGRGVKYPKGGRWGGRRKEAWGVSAGGHICGAVCVEVRGGVEGEG